MRRWTLALALAAASLAAAEGLPRRILLVPLDDRPAASQFAQMIGDMAGVQVDTPPAELLGRFTQPGRPEGVIEWLRGHLADYDVAIVSTDMVAYGGLIASRTDRTSLNLARKRLAAFALVRRTAPATRVFGFSSIMRLAPTAMASNAQWRMKLAKFVELRAGYRIDAKPETLKTLNSLRAQIPKGEIERYDAVRTRNHEVQRQLLGMAAEGVFGHLMLGQDDAQPSGPHVGETAALESAARSLSLGGRTFFASGIDQIANVLLSRSLLEAAGWSPRIRVVFADEAGRQKVAAYESEPVDRSLRDQIEGSGATVAPADGEFDYSLYINTPDPRSFALDAFLGSLKTEVDQGFPVAVADINLGKSGTGDLRLYEAVTESGRSSRVLAYAGWNTAGNTMGTTIPAANVYLLSRRSGVPPLHREVALRTFILHRLVNDFEYHKYVRPQAYAMIDSTPGATRDETSGQQLERVDGLVREDLGERLLRRFQEQLRGTRFFAGSEQFEVTGLSDVKIALPWPRAYEVKVSFRLQVEPVVAAEARDVGKITILPLGDGRGG